MTTTPEESSAAEPVADAALLGRREAMARNMDRWALEGIVPTVELQAIINSFVERDITFDEVTAKVE